MSSEVIRTGSYTALRLYNEVPHDVSVEASALFVGTIPNDWIRKHRRIWGKWKHLKKIIPSASDIAGGRKKKYSQIEAINDEVLCSPIASIVSVSTDRHSEVSDAEFRGDDQIRIDDSASESELEVVYPWNGQSDNGTAAPGRPLSVVSSISTRSVTPASSTRPLLQGQPNDTNLNTDSEEARGLNANEDAQNTDDNGQTATSSSEDGCESIRSRPIMVPVVSADTANSSISESNGSFFTARSSVSDSRTTEYQTPEPFHNSFLSRDGHGLGGGLIDFDDQSTIQLGSAHNNSDGQRTIDEPMREDESVSPRKSSPLVNSSQSDRCEDIDDSSLHSYHPDDNSNGQNDDLEASEITPSKQRKGSSKIYKRFSRSRGLGAATISARSGKSGPSSGRSSSQHRKIPKHSHKNDIMRRTERLLRRKKKGEALMIEKMLVMLKETMQPVPPKFNEFETIDTNIVDTWREYVVAARNTKDPDNPVALKFYSSRNIERVEAKGRAKFGVKVTRDFCLNLYSSLDKSFVLWNTDHSANMGVFSRLKKQTQKKTSPSTHRQQTVEEREVSYSMRTLLYIIKARSDTSALNWLTFLAGVIGIRIPETIEVSIPNLGTTADVEVPLFSHERKQTSGEAFSEFICYNELKRFTSARSHLLADIVDSIITNASQIDALREFIQEHWANKLKIGLCWKRYDRLEWLFDISGQIDSAWAMFSTHDLELRPKMPAAQPVVFPDGSRMQEPIPIEGFLHRFSSWAGKARKQHIDTRVYVHTHDHLLFYCSAQKAIPPVYDAEFAKGHNRGGDESPEIFKVEPFPTDANGDITWLKNVKSVEEFDRLDQKALFEMKRRVATIHNSDGCIDMSRIKLIRPSTGAEDKQFEIVFIDGLVLKLQATSARCKNTWVTVLTSHAMYWKQRILQDVQRISYIRKQNLELLHIDESSEGIIGESPDKWVTDRALADPYTYNIGPLSWSRSVNMKGYVFQKEHKYASFHKYYAVLTHAGLLLYQPVVRRASGAIKPKMNMKKVHSVSIDDCYVYSGPITNNDLLQRDKALDPENPGRHELPRVYEDGWKSSEEETTRCFVIWYGIKRPYASAVSNSSGAAVAKYVSRLGEGGKSMVFLVRSRQERDLWVAALNIAISRNSQSSVADNIVVQ